MNEPPRPVPNQWETPCMIEIYEDNLLRRIRYFSDLQMAYLFVKNEEFRQGVQPNRGDFLKSFEHTIRRLAAAHPNGYSFAAKGEKEFIVYYDMRNQQ
jgi:hypothetical protein